MLALLILPVLIATLPAPSVAAPASVAIVWHIASAPYAEAGVRGAAASLDAPLALAPIERALRAHPRTLFALAIDADAIEGLAHASAGDSALADVVAGRLRAGDPRATDLARVLASVPPADERLAKTPALARYARLADDVRRTLETPGRRVSSSDFAALAGLAVLDRLAILGVVANNSSLLSANVLSATDATSLVARLARADADGLDGMRKLAEAGQLEILADPAGEPLLPMLVDSGGKTSFDPSSLKLDTRRDAEYATTAALDAVRAGAPQGRVGLYSPHGAYDDKTAAMLAERGAAYALFSDRVLRSSAPGGSLAAASAADTASFHSYIIQAASTRALPALFWSEDESVALSSMPTNGPRSALGEGIAMFARAAAHRMAGAACVALVRLDADGAWSRRPDRSSVVDEIAAVLAREAITTETPGQYVRSGPAQMTVYGFAPAADEGPLANWTSGTNQVALWSALAQARQAAGADAALEKAAVRTPLLAAEASHWYAAASSSLPGADLSAQIEAFRNLIAQIYRSAGKTPPASIAPWQNATPKPANAQDSTASR